MISELDKSEFYKARRLINEQGQMEAKAVVEGVNPGRIFVDDVQAPTTGMIWLGNNDGFIFIGDERNERFTNEINDFIDRVIVPEAKLVGLEWFEGVGNHERWNKQIEELFKHRKLGNWNQKVYTLKKEDYSKEHEPRIDLEYSVLKMSKELTNGTYQTQFMESKILEFWSSLENFFNEGIGYCAVYKNEIVSVCFSGFVVENVHCVDIETLEEHQGKKLAQKIAHAFVSDCLERGMLPYWDCMEGNKPSVAVAVKIGFKNVFNYVGYEFPFN
ncbi:GNAT family N-acetyltransferase [Ureibacillus manganicus]|uniref:Acetyltransferase n=1 Tax=Ureibacillus manganicus DSM 26584 TaxID=1384049 RepID=A0A0A3HLP9_9BACL|nr:GNAT family N-acetyltransferase [Ureibacillus manganicus]KGR73501.1 acetyltransferase [Ureibacillus manganicus DSM 26584]